MYSFLSTFPNSATIKTTKIILAALISLGFSSAAFAQSGTTTSGSTSGSMGSTSGSMGSTGGSMGTTSGSMDDRNGTMSGCGTTSGSSNSGRRPIKSKDKMTNGKGKMKAKPSM